MSEKYVQCTLKRKNKISVVWIPERGTNGIKVKVGNKVLLKPENRWWLILTVSDPQDVTYIKNHERDYLTQRAASDI